MKYIKQVAKYNVYPCETSEEALKLLEKKKYNKIYFNIKCRSG